MSPGRSALRRCAPLLVGLLLASAGLLTAPDAAYARQPSRPAAPEEAGPDQQVLVEAARERGYACFRIPALVRTAGGDLLAFAEGRVHDCGDAGDIDNGRAYHTGELAEVRMDAAPGLTVLRPPLDVALPPPGPRAPDGRGRAE